MDRDPDVDVVILAWNDDGLVERAARSVDESLSVSTHVILVDNGSDVPLSQDKFAEALIVRNEMNAGVAAGRNQGASLGTAPFVLFLDSDAELRPCALSRLIGVLRSDPTIGVVGPVFEGQLPESSAGRAPTLRSKVSRGLGRISTYEPVPRTGSTWEVDVVIGACQCFRREAYEAVGGLDDRYFYGPEDVDFCMRVQQAGWQIVQAANADVFHPPRRRNRSIATRRGIRHAWAVATFLWRHRHYRSPRDQRRNP